LVWQLDRSEVMGSGLFWFGSIIGRRRPMFKRTKKRELGLHRLCSGFLDETD